MSDFDFYHKWLGIPPKDQPPHHYRLLAIESFESDPEVIAAAADSCMEHVHAFQTGEHSQDSQRLLNELASARVCLLNTEKKAQYDAALRAAWEHTTAIAARSVAAAPSVALPSRSPRAARVLDATTTAGQSNGLVILGDPANVPETASPKSRANGGKMRRLRWFAVVFAAAAATVLLSVLVTLFRNSRGPVTAADGQHQPNTAAKVAGKSQSRDPRPREKTAPTVEEPTPLRGLLPAANTPAKQVPAIRKRPVARLKAASNPETAVSNGPVANDGGAAALPPGARGQLSPRASAVGATPAAPAPIPIENARQAAPHGRPPRAAPAADSPGGPQDNELDGGEELSPNRMGKFIMALCEDLEGRVWVGTEDTGVWRYDPGAEQGKRWAQFTRARTGGSREPHGPVLAADAANVACLGDDNAYAVACDRLGRIWVGHLNHGVSVFNGKSWRNYDLLSGPLGERTFAIQTCPVDGDVWMATSAGLARYRIDADTWSYYTREDGLVADEIQCLAFDRSGTLYAGTQCDGVAVCKPVRSGGQLEYEHWRVFAAPAGLDEHPPITPCGEGLPSNLVNGVLVARDGALFVATTAGLAASHDGGRHWWFVRGQDWEAKARGLSKPPADEQVKAAAKLAQGRTLLMEDYVTCLEEDETGRLWIGHREKGYEVLDPRSGNRADVATPASPDKAGGQEGARAKSAALDFVTKFLPNGGEFLAGSYGVGMRRLARPTPDGRRGSPRVLMRGTHAAGKANASDQAADRGGPGKVSPVAPFPSPAAPPTSDELTAMLNQGKSTSAARPAERRSDLAYLGDDWLTWGDWVGRYGREYGVLCAANSPEDDVIHDPRIPVLVMAKIGPHCTADDSLRYWVHWVRTDNPRSLYDPVFGGRRQSEWDDHGEAYPRSHEGPDLWIRVWVPQGVHRIAFYFMNKDGHEGGNRDRDYLLEARQVPLDGKFEQEALAVRGQLKGCPSFLVGYGRLEDVSPAGQGRFSIDPSQLVPPPGRPPAARVARARVRDFWGGVYKRFLARGPAKYDFKVSRNGSMNTILSAVLVDRMTGSPTALGFHFRGKTQRDVVEDTGLPWMGEVRYDVPGGTLRAWSDPSPHDRARLRAPAVAWDAAVQGLGDDRGLRAYRRTAILAYRAGVLAVPSRESREMLENWRWRLPLWSAADRDGFAETTAWAWHQMQLKSPELGTKAFRKHSPNTYATREEWAARHLMERRRAVARVGKLQWGIRVDNDNQWTDIPNPFVALDGERLEFRAVPSPPDAVWPPGEPAWRVAGKAAGTGQITAFTFHIRTHAGEFQTLTADCADGEPVTANLKVVPNYMGVPQFHETPISGPKKAALSPVGNPK